MPRTKQAPKSTPSADEAPRQADTAVLEPLPPAEKTSSEKPAYAPDPHSKISVSLSDTNGGPEMHLLRSHKYKQMQIRFDHGQPDEQHLKMLTDMGWKDRTQSEGIFTKQIDPNARWQSVAKMEEEFKAVANAIRKDRGLGPVLEIAA
jgi:hypothetical protein